MASVPVVDAAGKKVGSRELPADIFEAKISVPLMHQVVVAAGASLRAGTHATKTRGDVSGGGKKPWRQKGTGRARQGSIRAVQMRGGGVAHGPVPRDYDQRTPKKMKAAALRGALSDRARDGKVHVFSSLIEGETPSTKTAVQAIAKVAQKNALVVLGRSEDNAALSLRNVPTIHVLFVDQLNTYDVLVADAVVFTQEALAAFLAGPVVGKSVKGVGTESEAAL